VQGHTKWITSLVWEPIHLLEPSEEVKRVATASKDASVRVWDAAANKVLAILTGHTASVTNVRWGGQVRVNQPCMYVRVNQPCM
jgi:ribosome assembly protein 4